MNTNHRYTSKFSGSGKSFQIRLDARKKGLRVAHIPIYTSLTPSELVTRIHRALIPIAISSLNIEKCIKHIVKTKQKLRISSLNSWKVVSRYLMLHSFGLIDTQTSRQNIRRRSPMLLYILILLQVETRLS